MDIQYMHTPSQDGEKEAEDQPASDILVIDYADESPCWSDQLEVVLKFGPIEIRHHLSRREIIKLRNRLTKWIDGGD